MVHSFESSKGHNKQLPAASIDAAPTLLRTHHLLFSLSLQLADSSPLKRELVEGVDILIVRELVGGIYFGQPRVSGAKPNLTAAAAAACLRAGGARSQLRAKGRCPQAGPAKQHAAVVGVPTGV